MHQAVEVAPEGTTCPRLRRDSQDGCSTNDALEIAGARVGEGVCLRDYR